MPDEPDKRKGPNRPAESTEENDRPTVNPPFDPEQFARAILNPSLAPPDAPPTSAHTRATPAAGMEKPGAGVTARPSPARRKTPTSTLSLANARIPSNLPPRVGEAVTHDSVSKMNPVDKEWAELELATRPPPADGPAEDPVLEIGADRPPRIDLDDIDLGEPRSGAETVRRPLRAEPREPEPLTPTPPVEPKSRPREMNDRVELGDYSGALEIAEEILRDTPDDIGAKTVAETCRTVLRQMYATRIGPLDRVPVVMVPRDQLRWLSIDHKAGFVLSLVDGVSSLEMIIDVSGMPELDTLRILSELAQQRIISLR